ncbi:SanA/YdcF family protein [Propionibacterium cyclohexanicum]|uniref:SanA/YdcF family protein n=1 Tax=Propionibacterium cyclohexanicum TaxID=64702 RepID=UPI00115FD79E|nr:YdcF family protein [Propionibacterium cyclohexanicum]
MPAVIAAVLLAAECVVQVLARSAMAPGAGLGGRSVALVLGAGVRHGRPTPYLRARLDVAARLWREGQVRVILVSGHAEEGYDEPDVMANYLADQGVPRRCVVCDGEGMDTWSSCLRAQRVYGVDALVVVTQAYHLPRALAACRMLGIDAQGAPDRSRARTARWWRYRLRELPAAVKLIADRATMRGAAGLAPDDAVARALAASTPIR